MESRYGFHLRLPPRKDFGQRGSGTRSIFSFFIVHDELEMRSLDGGAGATQRGLALSRDDLHPSWILTILTPSRLR